jgi:poly(3-hydroxybutyrate) depolymerase
MNIRKVAMRVGLVLIGLPIVLVLILLVFFYSVFYFSNESSATTGIIVSSGLKREYLLYVPKSYDRTKPTPLVICLHSSMS